MSVHIESGEDSTDYDAAMKKWFKLEQRTTDKENLDLRHVESHQHFRLCENRQLNMVRDKSPNCPSQASNISYCNQHRDVHEQSKAAALCLKQKQSHLGVTQVCVMSICRRIHKSEMLLESSTPCSCVDKLTLIGTTVCSNFSFSQYLIITIYCFLVVISRILACMYTIKLLLSFIHYFIHEYSSLLRFRYYSLCTVYMISIINF